VAATFRSPVGAKRRRDAPDIGKCAARRHRMDREAGQRDHLDAESRVTKRDGEPGRIRPFECGCELDPRDHDAETAGTA
jgi:hypothetical protein